jgi:hypothetical protein
MHAVHTALRGVNLSYPLPARLMLEFAANAGVQEQGFEELVGQLSAARPGLDVHWRVADSDNAPPGVGQQRCGCY